MQLTKDNIVNLKDNYNNKFIIYRIYNKISNKSYIGKCEKGLNRVLDHYKHCLNPKQEYRAKLLYRAIRKHGRDNFNFEVLFISFDILYLDEMEKFFIRTYNTVNPKFGYNITDGGTGGWVTRNYTKEQTEVYKQNLNKARKPLNEEQRQKQSALLKEIRRDPIKSKKNAEVCRERMLKLNKDLSFRNKMKLIHNMFIYCKELDMTWESQAECAKYFGVTQSYISHIIRNKKVEKNLRNCYTISIAERTCE